MSSDPASYPPSAAYSETFFQQFETAPGVVIYLSDNIQHFWPEVRTHVAGDTFIEQIRRMLAPAIIIGGIQQLARMWYLGLLERPATDWVEPFAGRILALAKS